MRRTFRDLLTTEMRENENISLLVGDVGYGLFDDLRKEFPNRVINPGASEQLMIGMAVGMAMEGVIPVVYSITPFVLYRPFEFIRNYVNHENIPVKLVGSAGISVGSSQLRKPITVLSSAITLLENIFCKLKGVPLQHAPLIKIEHLYY